MSGMELEDAIRRSPHTLVVVGITAEANESVAMR
jgi:hypothetical protein